MTETFDAAFFVRSQTTVAAPALVPEIQLHLASEITPLWEATEASLAARNIAPPYWAFAWPGGQALARYLLDTPQIVRGLRALDFAAGGGIAAIAAAKAGASAVAAADIDPIALAALRVNAELNGVRIATTQADLTRTTEEGPWDVVLAGDVCYERTMAEAALAWLRRLARRDALVLLADPGRAYAPSEGVVEIARYAVPTSLDLEDRPVRTTRVLRLMPA